MAGLLGLRGVSVLAGSGDWGVGLGCLAPDNKTLEFGAVYPATCPYITSVGGTVDVSPETAWNGSSGGFSDYFPRQSWQDAAVEGYMQTIANDTKAYYGQYTNFSGRGFPDIAAHSLAPDYRIYAGGQLANSGGTSAATPVVASIVALLNDARFRANKTSSLGWLNPLIYKYSDLFTDITSGYSVGCDGYNPQSNSMLHRAGYGVIPGSRWNATVGWDTTTGWGTPDFEKLKALVLTL
jgi:tripeptidyl-peptidase I